MVMNTQQPQHHVNAPVTIIGRHIRTNGPDSATTIPALWTEVLTSKALESIPGRISDDTYAVYTNLEHAGVSNDGHFSFIIGVPVEPGTPVPDGLALSTIPQSERVKFAAPLNDPTRIIEAWQAAWGYDNDTKTFICEYEHYSAHGEVSVNLGVNSGQRHTAGN